MRITESLSGYLSYAVLLSFVDSVADAGGPVSQPADVAFAAVRIVGGKVTRTLVTPVACCYILVNWCGSRYAIRGGDRNVRCIIFVVMSLLLVKILWGPLN